MRVWCAEGSTRLWEGDGNVGACSELLDELFGFEWSIIEFGYVQSEEDSYKFSIGGLDDCSIFETTRFDRCEACPIAGCKRYQDNELLKERPDILIDESSFSTLCRGIGQFCSLRGGEIVSQKKSLMTKDRTKK